MREILEQVRRESQELIDRYFYYRREWSRFKKQAALGAARIRPARTSPREW